jgi:hypothetical protein
MREGQEMVRICSLHVCLALGVIAALALPPFSDLRAQQSEHQPPGAPPPKPEPEMSQDQKWQSRFPQPVLVSDLYGRKIIDSRQGALGKITSVVETRDKGILIVFARRSLLLFDGDTVAVPQKFTAMLGPFVMVLDMPDDQIASLPVFSPDGTTKVNPASHIRMALTKH